MLNNQTRQKAVKSLNTHGSNALSCRYDRLCPFHRRGCRCKQHDQFLRWCSEKERNEAQTQMLSSSAAMVMLTFREDTINKIDCPFLHLDHAPATVSGGASTAASSDNNNNNNNPRSLGHFALRGKTYQELKTAAKQAVKDSANRQAIMIEALVDYFLVADATPRATAGVSVPSKKKGDDDDDDDQLLSNTMRTTSVTSNICYVPQDVISQLSSQQQQQQHQHAIHLVERDESSAIFADGIISSTKSIDDGDNVDDVQNNNNNNRNNRSGNDEDDDGSFQLQQQQPRQQFVASPFFNSLSDECRQQWRSFDITFASVDFCTCFASAVAVLVKSPELFGKTNVHSVYLGDNEISSDGLNNIIKALKMTMIPNDAASGASSSGREAPNKIAAQSGALIYGGHTSASSIAATTKNALAAVTGQTLHQSHQTLSSQIVLLDLSGNRLDSMHFLFELKVHFPKLLSLFINGNPITRRPDYRDFVRRTIPQVSMLDGESIRKPPLSMAFPTFESQQQQQQREAERSAFLLSSSTNVNSSVVNNNENNNSNKKNENDNAAAQRQEVFHRAARLFVAAYLRSWENDFSGEIYRDDDATAMRDAVMHPSILMSLNVQGAALEMSMHGGGSGGGGLLGDVMTDEMIAAATEAPGMRGGLVGTKSRADALQIAEKRLLSKHYNKNNNSTSSGCATGARADSAAAAAPGGGGRRRQRSNNNNNNNNAGEGNDDSDDEDENAGESNIRNATSSSSKQQQQQQFTQPSLSIEERKLKQLRIVTKLDAKLLRSLPVSLLRNSRNITEGVVSLERLGKGRLEVVELLAATLYPEGLIVSHHTDSAAICDVASICLPSLWAEQKEAAETAARQKTHAGIIAAAKAAAAKSKKQKAADDAASSSLFGQNKLKQPDLFIVTVHGLISWRVPSLVGQRTVTVAADHTFVVVATEEPEFFLHREEQQLAEQERFFHKMLRQQKRRQKEEGEAEGGGDEHDASEEMDENSASDDDDDDDDDGEFKTLLERQRDELLQCMKGFRLCNHAVTLRPQNKTAVGDDDEEGHESSSSSSSAAAATDASAKKHAAKKTAVFPYARFLFDPFSPARVQRLAHLYGATPESVLRVMEQLNSDAACEAVLAKSMLLRSASSTSDAAKK